MCADGSIDFLNPRDCVCFIDDAAAELLTAQVKKHCVRTVGFADLESTFADIIGEQLSGAWPGREDQHGAAGSFWFRGSCAGVRRQRRGGLREPQYLRLMMSAVRELVHDVLDLRAGEGERRREGEKGIRPDNPQHSGVSGVERSRRSF
ncbi:MAG: hypothetical protein RL215_1898 [Planctomycetota bacterium]